MRKYTQINEMLWKNHTTLSINLQKLGPNYNKFYPHFNQLDKLVHYFLTNEISNYGK